MQATQKDKQTENGRHKTAQKTKDQAILKSGPDMKKISLNKKFYDCMFIFIY